jgi:hypothetical protein
VKIYSGPTTDSTTSATLLWEIGHTDDVFFDSSNDLLMTSPLTIQFNHYLIVENVDDSRAELNDVTVYGLALSTCVHNMVVERGA